MRRNQIDKQRREKLGLKDIDAVEEHIVSRLSNVKPRKKERILGEYQSTIAMIVQRPDYLINLRSMIVEASVIIDKAIVRSKEDEAIAKLTYVSIDIGRSIVNNDENVSTETLILIGDIFIDGFWVRDMITLEQTFWSTRHDMTWFVGWTDRGDTLKNENWDNGILLRDTANYIPEKTTKNLREYAERRSLVVKRADAGYPIDPSSIHMQALDKIQSQAWMVNDPVMEEVLANAYMFTQGNEGKDLSFLYTTKKAAKAQELGVFWQVFDIDYRGRFYTMEPFLQFQGNDIARGMFLFAEGKPMIGDAWAWLFIHAANNVNLSFHKDEQPDWLSSEDWKKYVDFLTLHKLDTISLDKMMLDDRATWTEFNIGKIQELGRNADLWVEMDENGEKEFVAENPVVFLAACIEINRLIENPDQLSYLPIAVDGSNNGWQHLIAMAGDGGSAQLVGMSNSEIPEDFYLATGKELLNQLAMTSQDRVEFDPKSGKDKQKSGNKDDAALLDKIKVMPMKDVRKGISKRSSIL